MREIKFRALLQKIGEKPRWIYYTTNELAYTDDGSWDVVKVNDSQYTGLKDVHGRDIYEGDLIKTHRDVFEVKYKDCTFGRMNSGGIVSLLVVRDYEGEELEVIGNVYEHPDLLPHP